MRVLTHLSGPYLKCKLGGDPQRLAQSNGTSDKLLESTGLGEMRTSIGAS